VVFSAAVCSVGCAAAASILLRISDQLKTFACFQIVYCMALRDSVRCVIFGPTNKEQCEVQFVDPSSALDEDARVLQAAMSAYLSAQSAAMSIAPTVAFGSVLASDEIPLFEVRDITDSSQLQRDVNFLDFRLKANVPTSAGQLVRIVLDRDFFPTEIKVRDQACNTMQSMQS
jgi:hypothetical protein